MGIGHRWFNSPPDIEGAMGLALGTPSQGLARPVAGRAAPPGTLPGR